jgi:two-component system, OmpR family, phosphate regulon response regulator OmpR
MAKFLHILIVENDSDVREVLRLLLKDLGYRVSVAANAAAARPVLDRLCVDLLVTDQVMSGETGRELADYARTLGIPALLMSGHNEIRDEFDRRPDFIGKPFRQDQLQQAILRVLATPQGDANDG